MYPSLGLAVYADHAHWFQQ